MRRTCRFVRKSVALGICCVLLSCGAARSQCDDTRRAAPRAPRRFNLSEASIEYTWGGMLGSDTIRIRGDGEGEWRSTEGYSRQISVRRLHYSADDFMQLLREFYRGQFYFIGSSYPVRYWPSEVSTQGRVEMTTSVICDVPEIKLVLRVRDYCHAVFFLEGAPEFQKNKPAVLDSLARAVTEFADRHAEPHRARGR